MTLTLYCPDAIPIELPIETDRRAAESPKVLLLGP